jgi:hypothetical protein
VTDRVCDAALEVWLAQNPPKSASVITAFRGGFEAGRSYERARRRLKHCPKCGLIEEEGHACERPGP